MTSRAASRLFLGSCLLTLSACSPDVAAPLSSDTAAIIHGEATADFPAVGGLTHRGEFHCTATLVGCDTILTAAHCVCDGFNPDDCHEAADYDFFLPNVGSFKVLEAIAHPGQDGFINDVAVMRLDRPVEGVRPMRLVEEEPAIGTPGTLVGFGQSAPSRFSSKAFKQVGHTVTEECQPEFFTGTFEGWEETGLCWILSDDNAGTCNGDSGGPMFVEEAGELRVASTASGALAKGDNCSAGAQDVQTSVAKTGAFLAEHIDFDGEACSSFPEVGDANVKTEALYEFRRLGDPIEQDVEVNEGTRRLVAAGGGVGAIRLSIVKIDEHGDETVVCESSAGYLRTCVVEEPEAGLYLARGVGHFTGGDLQLIVTAYGADLTDDDGDEDEECEKCDDLDPAEQGGCAAGGAGGQRVGLLLWIALALLLVRRRA